MTNQELIDYYCSLLLMQYKNLPKATSTIAAYVKLIIMDQVPVQVLNAYGIDTAEGTQLDVLGKYAGVSRTGYIFSGPTTLNDTNFRFLIKVAIIQNNSGSSLADIQNLISIYFSNILRVYDYQTMRMGYIFNSESGSNILAEFFVKQGSLPRPMGVRLSALIYAPLDSEFFSFITYDDPSTVMINGFNTYEDYNMSSPWITYEDAIAE